MKKIIIAIDGHSACGKSSTAKVVAKKLGYMYIDSGAMYRATTYNFLQEGVDTKNPGQVDQALENTDIQFKIDGSGNSQVLLNGTFAEEFIRTMEVNQHVSEVSAISSVRRAMVSQQRQIGTEKGVVMDGRDIGSVVFPKAELKIFMTASLEVRAKRRQKELQEKGVFEELSDISSNLKSRDEADSTRADSPLVQAEDAIVVDTTHLTFNDQVDKIVKLAEQIIYDR
ncbi:MAG: (d)CMP kinase [Cyclobacteriaceae bacterium]|nr:(d)CMP kinase [Cyclobacteriaceae bacterium SS2]